MKTVCVTCTVTLRGLLNKAFMLRLLITGSSCCFPGRKFSPDLQCTHYFLWAIWWLFSTFVRRKNVGVLIAVQPTSIYLIVGKYNLNASGKRCLLETDISVWCDTVIPDFVGRNFSNLTQSTAFRLVVKYLSQSSIATNIGTLYSLIVRAQSELSYHQMSLVTQCVMMRPLWLTSAHCHWQTLVNTVCSRQCTFCSVSAEMLVTHFSGHRLQCNTGS